jgi:hypothetical protein
MLAANQAFYLPNSLNALAMHSAKIATSAVEEGQCESSRQKDKKKRSRQVKKQSVRQVERQSGGQVRGNRCKEICNATRPTGWESKRQGGKREAREEVERQRAG